MALNRKIEIFLVAISEINARALLSSTSCQANCLHDVHGSCLYTRSASYSALHSEVLLIMKLLRYVFFLAFTWSLTTRAELQKPDVVLEGAVTVAQNHTHFYVPFTVPAGVHRISVDFSYDHRHEEKTVFNIGIHDPVGFRGQSGSNKDHFTIGPGDATASYIPGSIPPGQWKFLISVSNIRPDVTSKYRVEIRFNSPIEDSSFTLVPLETNLRWYRGDLHMHTAHSDGFCGSQNGKHVPCPLFLTVKTAGAEI